MKPSDHKHQGPLDIMNMFSYWHGNDSFRLVGHVCMLVVSCCNHTRASKSICFVSENICYVFVLRNSKNFNFSRMRSKGSRFTLGVWGLRVCSLDVAEPFATVRNRLQPFATVRNTSRYFVSRGRRGTS